MFLKNLKSNLLFYSTIAFGYVILRKRTLIQNCINKNELHHKLQYNYNNNYNRIIYCKTCKGPGNYDLCMPCWMKMLDDRYQ